MTVNLPDTSAATEKPASDKEFNFRQLEAKNARERAQDRAEIDMLRKQLEDIQKVKETPSDDEEVSNEPYVEHKFLNKRFDKFERKLEEKFDKRAEEKAKVLIERQKQEMWLKQNPDFYDVMQHANSFAQKDPELADTILEMPDTFERQKLVYKNIKALGLHKPPEQKKETSIQDKIAANQRSPYYQPSGIGSAPYNAAAGDFSPSGQKNAYAKMQELKRRLGH